mmetsp:Transcript_29161/g.53706  ORF Transcript_29161/g.53706 Transcript_29161/m.53706 type:complete len:201 (-) Transcript_29161:1886-2488(-)
MCADVVPVRRRRTGGWRNSSTLTITLRNCLKVRDSSCPRFTDSSRSTRSSAVVLSSTAASKTFNSGMLIVPEPSASNLQKTVRISSTSWRGTPYSSAAWRLATRWLRLSISFTAAMTSKNSSRSQHPFRLVSGLNSSCSASIWPREYSMTCSCTALSFRCSLAVVGQRLMSCMAFCIPCRVSLPPEPIANLLKMAPYASF